MLYPLNTFQASNEICRLRQNKKLIKKITKIKKNRMNSVAPDPRARTSLICD